MQYSITAKDDCGNSWHATEDSPDAASANAAALRFAASLLADARWSSTRLNIDIAASNVATSTFTIMRADPDAGDRVIDLESEAHPS